MPSNMTRFRKLMGAATIFYFLGAVVFLAKVFSDVPSGLMLVGVGLVAIGLYFNIRAMAKMRR